MITSDSLHVYSAIQSAKDRSHLEDNLVLDGFDVSSFESADDLWAAFQQKPSRMVITDRRFPSGLNGLELTRKIRDTHPLPYVYVVVLSVMNRLKEIKEGLGAGVDDYLIKPHNPLQLRSRVLIGLRWLNYIDSLFENKPEKR